MDPGPQGRDGPAPVVGHLPGNPSTSRGLGTEDGGRVLNRPHRGPTGSSESSGSYSRKNQNKRHRDQSQSDPDRTFLCHRGRLWSSPGTRVFGIEGDFTFPHRPSHVRRSTVPLHVDGPLRERRRKWVPSPPLVRRGTPRRRAASDSGLLHRYPREGPCPSEMSPSRLPSTRPRTMEGHPVRMVRRGSRVVPGRRARDSAPGPRRQWYTRAGKV